MWYLIEYECDVYEDSFLNGEGKHVNWWNGEFMSKKKTAFEAMQDLFENELCYSLDTDYVKCEDDLPYSVTVNKNNYEADGSELEAWRMGEIDLYVNYIHFEIFELKKVDLNEIHE